MDPTRRQQLTRPAHAEIVAGQRARARKLAAGDQIVSRCAAVPAKRDAGIDSGHDRRTGEIAAGSILLSSPAGAIPLRHAGTVRRSEALRAAPRDLRRDLHLARTAHASWVRPRHESPATPSRGGWRSVVIAEQRHDVIRGRADDGKRLDVARQRQQTIVLQQHDRGPRCAPRQRSCSVDWLTEYGICAQRTRSGGSNIPRRKRVSIKRCTADHLPRRSGPAARRAARRTSCRSRDRSLC